MSTLGDPADKTADGQFQARIHRGTYQADQVKLLRTAVERASKGLACFPQELAALARAARPTLEAQEQALRAQEQAPAAPPTPPAP